MNRQDAKTPINKDCSRRGAEAQRRFSFGFLCVSAPLREDSFFCHFGITRVAILILLYCGSVVMGDGPTSQPAGAATDAFRAFLLDIQQGNPADLAKLCTANGEDARTLFHDFQALASAMRYLRTAVTAKFGADAVDAVLPALPTLTDLDDVNEKVTGDRAELSGESVWPIHLTKIQGRWELDLDWLAKSEDMPGNPHWFGLMARAIRRTGDDVASGRLGTVEAASMAMQAREQTIPDSSPSTEASTGPTTEPTTEPTGQP